MQPALIANDLPSELGLTPVAGGVEVAAFCRNGDSVLLCLFDEKAEREIARLPLPSRTGDIHHGFLADAGAGLKYGLRAQGPYAPERGHRYDVNKLLVDPYARLIDRPYQWRAELAAPPSAAIDTAPFVPRSVVTATHDKAFVQKEAKPSLIYEASARGLTRKLPPPAYSDPIAALAHPLVAERLKHLGVSHLELLPIAAWMDERHLAPLGLSNAWGYNPVNFFTLDPRLSTRGAPALTEVVEAYDKIGVRLILDVVFNHAAESDAQGATISLRGLDNAVYYRHARDDPGQLINDTGCGNTLALDRAPVLRMAMDALRHWRRCGVAGFRFDLATVLGRTEDGFDREAPLLAAIAQDPELRDAILIAEPWDLGPGGYRLGDFPPRFSEWNGRFRDDLRRFWRGDDGAAGALATRLCGSSDIFQSGRRPPSASVNYLAAHDGFTLADLVSYRQKHNQANGEQNRDGTNDNLSWNNGVEGASDDERVIAARDRDVRAMLATLFVSRGIPMLQAGDEMGRSQGGNNNAYAQDGPEFALDWEKIDKSLVEFVATLAAFRKSQPALVADAYFAGGVNGDLGADVSWWRADGTPMRDDDWSRTDNFAIHLTNEASELLLIFNRGRQDSAFAAPNPSTHSWREAWRSFGSPSSEIIAPGARGMSPARTVCAWLSI